MEQPDIVVRIEIESVGGQAALLQLVSELCADVCAKHGLEMEGSADRKLAELFFKGSASPMTEVGRNAIAQWFADRGLAHGVEILPALTAAGGPRAA